MKQRKLEDLEVRLMQTQTGRAVHEILVTHAEEVMELINHRRPVTVAWHRNHGPELIGQVVKSGFEHDFEIPKEIQGVTLAQLLRRMASVMLDHASPEFKAVINRYYALVMGWAQQFTNLSQVLDEIARLDQARAQGNGASA